MKIERTLKDGVTIFTLQGRLDGNEAGEFEREVLASLEQGAANLLFDCRDLDYINSSGLRVLVMAYQRLSGKNGLIAICSLKDYIQEIFDISGYDKIFSMHPDRDAALQSFLTEKPGDAKMNEGKT